MAQDPKRTAIVTGGARGIGRAVALRLARDGFAVVVNYAAHAEAAADTVAEIRAAGGVATAILADVSDAAAVQRLFAEAHAAYGAVDVVVANAGVLHDGPIATFPLDAFDRLIAVNLRGTFTVMQAAAQALRPGGRIVAVSTSLVAAGRPGSGPYAATKAAVEVLVKVLAKELAGRDITVNGVAPGPVETDLYLARRTPDEVRQGAALAPLGRLGKPDDIAGAVAMLVGPDGGWINGQTIRVNGGYI